ncbi:E3 binding domain-containing protein [Dysosmobacter welbionis]|uniref:E3 binding domain-containing protein n=1 Tax=Dysosmobacter welbionis TaxID=2093857 RepID=UPI0031F66D5F
MALQRKTAREAGIDLADVAPTDGPTGERIVAKDVEAYLSPCQDGVGRPRRSGRRCRR